MKRPAHRTVRHNLSTHDQIVFCAETGKPIQSDLPPNIIPFPRFPTSTGNGQKIDQPRLIENDDI